MTKKLNQTGSTHLILVVGVVVVVAVGVTGWLVYKWRQPTIKSFDQCVKAGYPVQESFPEVCTTPSGQHFSRPMQLQAKLSPEPTPPPSSSTSWQAYTTPDGQYTISLADGLSLLKSDDGHYLFTYTPTFKPGTPAKVMPVQGGGDTATGLFIDFQNLGNHSDRGTKSTPFNTTQGLPVTKYSYTQTANPDEWDIPKGYTENSYTITNKGKTVYITYTVPSDENLPSVEKMVQSLSIN